MLSIFGTLFTMPDASTSLNAIGEWSAPLFTDFLDLIWYILGFAFIIFLIRLVLGIFKSKD